MTTTTAKRPPVAPVGTARINPDLHPLAVSLAWFREDPDNLREHDAASVDGIAASLHDNEQQKPIVALEDGTVIAGNGTLRAAIKLGWPALAAVVFRDREKAEAFAIADNRTPELSRWSPRLGDRLKEIAASGRDLGRIGFDAEALKQIAVTGHMRALPGAGAGDQDRPGEAVHTYTQKIKPPIYEPKTDKPPASALYDDSRAKALEAEINASGLPEDVAAFLRLAATRHVVFNFGRIADFYAHSDAATQALMERSALVIIDFNKAIEHGFVRLTGAIGALVEQEKDAADDA